MSRPTTADGVTIEPGMRVWVRTGGTQGGTQRCGEFVVDFLRTGRNGQTRVRLQRVRGHSGCYRAANLCYASESMARRKPRPSDMDRKADRAALWYGGTSIVPDNIALCPECYCQLEVECNEWETDNGKPTFCGLYIICPFEMEEIEELGRNTHSGIQSLWQPVKDRIAEWVGVSY